MNALASVLVLLGSAVVVVALFRVLRLPPLLAYIFVGVTIGPNGQGWIPASAQTQALAEFGGIHRRFEVCGEVGGIMVVSDYGHHPAEIRATLAAAREGFARRLVVLFQPHRYTRTRDLFGDFLDAFDAADQLLLTEIYPAGEEPIDGVTGDVLYYALRRRGHLDVTYVPDWRSLAAVAQPLLRPGDLVVVLGAGPVHEVGETLVRALSGGQASAFSMQ